MASIRRLLLACVLLLATLQTAYAASFVVRHIDIRGRVGLSESTVLSYIPVHVGQRFTQQTSNATLQALFRTGFFSNVRLYQRGSTLVVVVHERPTIGLIQVTGNKAIPKKKLKPILKRLGLVEGQVFDQAKLQEVVVGLHEQYKRMGHYASNIETQVLAEPRGRVAIHIHVSEGPIARIHRIVIVGNHAFSQHTLMKNFKLSHRSIFTLLSHKDRYSKIQLQMDLQQLHSFYFDHGYLRFRVVSQDVQITPDHRSVVITVHVHEGPVFTISGYRVTGQGVDTHVQHMASTFITTGAVFSRKNVMELDKSVTHYFADRGFAFATVKVNPKVNDAAHTVYLSIVVVRGRLVYVRRIMFAGNHRTKDSVLRMQVHQMPASVFSLKDVNESKRKLANLPYLRHITVTPVPVPGVPGQVDLHYSMTEVNAGKASVNGGYSDVYGFLYGANIAEPNFLGTGKYVSLGFTRSEYQQNYQFAYNNPFYTMDGVSRGFQIYYNRTTANGSVNLDTYTTDDFGGQITYGIPMSNFDTLTLGAGFDYIRISNVNSVTSGAAAAPNVLQFLGVNPPPFNQVNFVAGWTHATLDQAIFPNSGGTQTLTAITSAPVFRESIGYYKFTYNGRYYIPINHHGFILMPHMLAGYGGGYGSGINSALPFYNNFYAGGIQTMPGFEPNTLGPKNPNNSNAAMGGNVQLIGGINLIFPNPVSTRIRTSVFIDAGNVFQTTRTQYTAAQVATATAAGQTLTPISYEGVSFKNMRVSTGLLVTWWSPLGLISVDLATPIVKKAGDQSAIFGFTFGTSV